MLDDNELCALARALESEQAERKEAFVTKKEEICQAICAFANDLAASDRTGYLLIGVKDDGTPANLTVTDELIRSVADLRSAGNILPPPSMTVERRKIDGASIILVSVKPSASPPVAYKGRIYIRTGSRRGIASRDDERILNERRRWFDRYFLDRICADADISELDLSLFESTFLPASVASDVLAANERTQNERMQALRLVDDKNRASFLALLTLGKSPRDWLPGAYIQFVRFDGTELTDPILDQKIVDGSISRMASIVDDLLKVNIRLRTVLPSQGPERRTPDYPDVALRELVRNALLHRSYEIQSPIYLYWFSDRIEIHSPGGLFGRVTEGNFGKAGYTDYRNASLASALKNLGFVQQFGIGVALARKACEENHNPPPSFEFGPSAVMACIRSQP